MHDALVTIIGNHTAARFLVYLVHHGQAYPSAAARDLGMSIVALSRQLDKFEAAGLLVSRMVGNTRIYTFNEEWAIARKFRELVRLFHRAMTPEERAREFPKGV
jgi:DNA-binding transcriptional ArsR family regulator